MLKHYYQMAIQPKTAQQIILAGTPATINAWMTKAAEVDSAFRRTNALFSKGISHGNGNNNRNGKKKNWKPHFYSSSGGGESSGEPMDID